MSVTLGSKDFSDQVGKVKEEIEQLQTTLNPKSTGTLNCNGLITQVTNLTDNIKTIRKELGDKRIDGQDIKDNQSPCTWIAVKIAVCDFFGIFEKETSQLKDIYAYKQLGEHVKSLESLNEQLKCSPNDEKIKKLIHNIDVTVLASLKELMQTERLKNFNQMTLRYCENNSTNEIEVASHLESKDDKVKWKAVEEYYFLNLKNNNKGIETESFNKFLVSLKKCIDSKHLGHFTKNFAKEMFDDVINTLVEKGYEMSDKGLKRTEISSSSAVTMTEVKHEIPLSDEDTKTCSRANIDIVILKKENIPLLIPNIQNDLNKSMKYLSKLKEKINQNDVNKELFLLIALVNYRVLEKTLKDDVFTKNKITKILNELIKELNDKGYELKLNDDGKESILKTPESIFKENCKVYFEKSKVNIGDYSAAAEDFNISADPKEALEKAKETAKQFSGKSLNSMEIKTALNCFHVAMNSKLKRNVINEYDKFVESLIKKGYRMTNEDIIPPKTEEDFGEVVDVFGSDDSDDKF